MSGSTSLLNAVISFRGAHFDIALNDDAETEDINKSSVQQKKTVP